MALLLPRLAGLMLSGEWHAGLTLLSATVPSLSNACQYATAPQALKSRKFQPKTAGKPTKKKAPETASSPRRAAVIEMLLHHHHPFQQPQKQPSSSPAAPAPSPAKYLKLREEHTASLAQKTAQQLELRRQALAALPAHLRQHAMQPDLTPFPPARKFYFDAPPAIYMQPEGGSEPQAASPPGTKTKSSKGSSQQSSQGKPNK